MSTASTIPIPNIAGDVASRYAELDWKTARIVAGKLVQRRAVEVAEQRRVVVEVAALGREAASPIGLKLADPVPAGHPRERRVALAGCGVVGGGVLQRLLGCPGSLRSHRRSGARSVQAPRRAHPQRFGSPPTPSICSTPSPTSWSKPWSEGPVRPNG